MKKITASISIFLLLLSTANAQKIKAGMKAGLNLSGVNSNIELQNFQTGELLPGLNGGLVFEFAPVKTLGIRAEALFSQKGYSIDNNVVIDGSDAVINTSLKMDYIEIPLLLRLKTGHLYFTAGPYFSYAVSGKDLVSITIDGQKLAEELYGNYGQIPSNDVFKSGEFNGDNITYKRTDAGLSIGTGIKLLNFFIEARYTTGLENIKDYDGIPADEFTKNYTISLSAGIFIK